MAQAKDAGLNNAEVVGIALRAGSVAIVTNTLLLTVADQFGLTTARGGLLKLLITWLAPGLRSAGLASWALWLTTLTKTYAFQTGFHIAVGLVMALVFVKSAGTWLKHHAWCAGLAAAFAVWLLNALVILPLLGEGFAGEHDLTLPGIAYFAAAHTAFFLLMALIARRQVLRVRAV
jgi:hypothetical protein